jgi:hypothetical protein
MLEFFNLKHKNNLKEKRKGKKKGREGKIKKERNKKPAWELGICTTHLRIELT